MSLPAFLITFSDGLEAFLVVAAAIAFLRKTRQHALASAVHWGIAVSVATSLVGAWLFSRSDNQAAWQARFALVAAAAVVGLGAYMWRMRRLLWKDSAPEAERSTGRRAGLAFLIFTALVVSRVGIHMALLIGTFLFQVRVPALTVGVVSGVVFAGLIAWLWARYGHRLRLLLFAPITVLVLAVALAQLVSDALQNLSTANAPAPIQQLDFSREG